MNATDLLSFFRENIVCAQKVTFRVRISNGLT